MPPACIFCEILAGRAPASFVHRDELVSAFLDIQPMRPGVCLVIPNAHVDHFTDLDDRTAQHALLVGQRIGRRMREVFRPLRIGFVVSGFGVAHAHLIVVPQHDPSDITSGRFARLEGGKIAFGASHIPRPERALLDEQARQLGPVRLP